jgi:hypothetical protein
MMTIAKP